jgi:tetratricopeptide (TPR) repeat protein
MTGRGGWWRLIFAASLLGLWLISAWGQEQPPELEAIYKRGLQLYEAGKFADAVPVAEEYISVARAKYGEEHPVYATGLVYLGALYNALDRQSEAESLFKRALAIKEKSLGFDHTDVADALHIMAESYRRQGRLSIAEPLYRRTLSIAEKALGPEHPSIGIVLGTSPSSIVLRAAMSMPSLSPSVPTPSVKSGR